MSLEGKSILVTGAGVRLGRHIAITLAKAGADILVHYNQSNKYAEETAREIRSIGREARLIQFDLSKSQEAGHMMEQALKQGPVYGIVHNAAMFEPLRLPEVTPENWQCHMDVNLASPFFISQAFFNGLGPVDHGRIITMLDWRALRPGVDHLPYTISKAGLAALTKTLALSMAPRVTVNGIALGAILPPAEDISSDKIIQPVPMKRWADLDELGQTILFLMDGPEYITGEIIHLDGGRHLV
jgi:NAD(P)-dependent dehydrogenase (short-subunit alcohol dehydrogenase family)